MILFIRGRITLGDGTGLPGATFIAAIPAPENMSLTSASSDATGWAEAGWNTQAPNRKGQGGTLPGVYGSDGERGFGSQFQLGRRSRVGRILDPMKRDCGSGSKPDAAALEEAGAGDGWNRPRMPAAPARPAAMIVCFRPLRRRTCRIGYPRF